MLTQTKNIIRDLGDGLILRHGSQDDADALCAFNARINGDDEEDGKRVAAWTRDLISRPHPTFKPEDFTIVEEAATGKIVSSLSLIPQTWTYEGIEFGVGRPELVGTDPDYRGKGLATRMLAEAVEECRRQGFDKIIGKPFIWSAHPQRQYLGVPNMYEDLGFHKVSEVNGVNTYILDLK